MSDETYNERMTTLALAPMKRLSRPQQRRKHFVERLQGVTDDATRKHLLRQIQSVEKQCNKPFRMTNRDHAIIEGLARFRFLTAPQIAPLVGGSKRKLTYRLHLLWLHGFLDRPANQRVYLSAFYDHGNPDLLYALGREGAKLLAQRG